MHNGEVVSVFVHVHLPNHTADLGYMWHGTSAYKVVSFI